MSKVEREFVFKFIIEAKDMVVRKKYRRGPLIDSRKQQHNNIKRLEI